MLAIGFATLASGMIAHTQFPANEKFVSNLLPGYLLVGAGLALGFIAVSIAGGRGGLNA